MAPECRRRRNNGPRNDGVVPNSWTPESFAVPECGTKVITAGGHSGQGGVRARDLLGRMSAEMKREEKQKASFQQLSMATGWRASATALATAVATDAVGVTVDNTPPRRSPPRATAALSFEESCGFTESAFVSEHSAPHRSRHAVQNAWKNGSPPSIPARRGRRPLARNEPHELVRQIWAIYRDVSSEDRTHVLRRVNAVRGEEKISRSAFPAKYEAVLVMLNALPRIRFLQPTEEDANGVLARMLEVGMHGVIRVGSYALTYRPIVDTLIWLRIKRPDVTMKVLYDRHWCWTSHQALIALGRLYFFGVETRHTRSTSLHMKMTAVGYTYCFSGSANFGEAGFGGNVELNTVVKAGICTEACCIFDNVYDGITDRSGIVQRAATVTTRGDALRMVRAGVAKDAKAHEKRAVVGGGGDVGNAYSNQFSSCHG
ncbi:hypothetical protein PHYPSEUDO_005915 [Phytophthora pseudosyringae]|uniref:Phospholipase D-like domain-containing protein n=1 Tax=Phytophthora pseudosyringae TaxID=221518 RepID=A0A8T1VJW9_9STRA|nr:hypothetical protein PHYPSEUDO_005915 [Phytophthora pseudosyringae]